MTIPEILTNDFWTSLATNFTNNNHETLGTAISNSSETILKSTILSYEGLKILPFAATLTTTELASTAYLVMGEAFSRIFDALSEKYDPLENFFTDGQVKTDDTITFHKDGKEINTRNGNETTTPTGKILNETSGSREREYNGRENVGQGTTFESFSDNDFRNISKNIEKGTDKETFNNYVNATSYDAHKVTHSYDNVTSELSFDSREDTSTTDGTVTSSKRGNSGIFSKQDLTAREIKLRLNYKPMSILIRMVVDVFNSGVWE